MRLALLPAFALLLASVSCATAPRATQPPPAPPAQPAPSPAPASEPPVAAGPLTPQLVADYVRAQAPMVRGCYDRELDKKHDVSGKLLMRWTIDELGGTRGIVVELNTMRDTAVADCIQVLIRDWHFAKPPAGPISVNFPFTFEAVEGARPPKQEPNTPKTSI
jgi:hypothetical protein